MTLFDRAGNINMSFLTSGMNNWFNPSSSMFCGNFMPNFGWNIPSLFNFSSFIPNFSGWNFSSLWNSNNSVNWNFPSSFSFNSSISFNPSSMKLFDDNIWANSPAMTFSPPVSNWNNFTFQQSNTDTFTSTRRSSSSLQLNLVSKAKSYLGKVNSDAEGNRLFSGGNHRPWCADFVSYVTRQTYGSKLPSSFKAFSSVSSLRTWGKENGCYKEMPSSSKASFIANNVKPGDIMIEKRNGTSHTGIVTKVNSDGSFETVEGNSSSKVKTVKHTAESRTLSGFISLDKYSSLA